MCGAVTYTATPSNRSVGACHCSMCRQWSGGVFISMEAKPDEINFEGEENIATFKSSPWAERAFCKNCGSSLYYRITAPGPYQGVFYVGSGTLDDYGDLKFDGQLYIDAKPAAYSFAEHTKNMTKAEVEEMFGGPQS